jgi:hypothetical protein
MSDKALLSPDIGKEGVGIAEVTLASPGPAALQKDWDIVSNGSLDCAGFCS